MKNQWFKTALMAFMFAIVLTGCKKENENGNVDVQLTDDPFPLSFVSEANIGFSKIEIRNEETGEYYTVFEGNSTYNVAALNNGATASVTTQSVPQGTYDEIRITIDGVSIKLTDGRELDAQISGSIEANSKIYPALEVSNGGDASLLIDMDLADSFDFATQGIINNIITSVTQILNIAGFDPDIRAAATEGTGIISGTVTDTQGNVYANATVELETGLDLNGDGEADTITTLTDATGSFKFLAVPEGSYQVEVEAEDGTELVSDGQVTVTAGAEVTVNVFHSH
ncbi:MAG: DUF4382 domain-containing protein [Chlorobi bacterium]|nr:DUF4382 domain-containing protein [Chlorobiota bacterium]